MSRTASRYQRGLSYEPGMSESRYRPERATADLGNVGDYTGVSPIPGGSGGDGGGVVAPFEGATGNGLGGGGNLLAGLALTALTNPRVTNYLTDQLRGGRVSTVSGRPLDGSVTYEQMTGTPVRDGGVTIEPMQPTTDPNGVQFRDLGSQQGGNILGGGARVLDNSLTYEQLMGLPYNPNSGVTIAPMSPTTGPGGVQFREVPWPDGGSGGVMDGGTSGIDFGGVADGAGGADGGSIFGNLFSMYGGLTGSAALDAVGSLGGGAIGNYIVRNSSMAGRRDTTGRDIGAAVGAIIGSPIPFFGPLIGSVIGGGIGGQFGPMATVGGNWGTLNAYTPGAGWSSQTGADNGGTPNADFSTAFQNALLAYAQSQGMEANPLNSAMYTVGQYTGNGPNAPGSGYYYQPAGGPQEGVPLFFTNDLSGANPTYGTYGNAMLNVAYNDLANQGFWTPIGTGLTGEALQTELGNRAAAAAAGNAQHWAGLESNAGPGN